MISNENSGEKKNKSPASEFEGTTVDLGEDLLDATRALTRNSPSEQNKVESKVSQETSRLQDEIQRGEIFFAERLFEDAKRIFRKVLRKKPDNATARKYLDEIQQQELRELLSGDPLRQRLGSDGEEEETPLKIAEKLEKELRLNREKEESDLIPGLFGTQEDFEKYRSKISETLQQLSPRDCMDLGIAHPEMGLFEIAQLIFEQVIRHEEFLHTGMYLLGLALIFGGKSIEATIRLEPLCRNITLAEGPKTDFLYLMGLAFDHLNDKKKARAFYRRVFLMNPRYRDIIEKLK